MTSTAVFPARFTAGGDNGRDLGCAVILGGDCRPFAVFGLACRRGGWGWDMNGFHVAAF